MAEANIATVAVSGIPYPVDKPFSYLIPAELSAAVLPGVRVLVPFGRGNKPTEAMVFSVGTGERTPRLKQIFSTLDAAPLLDEQGLRLARWMKARYFCTLYDAIKTILPAGIWYDFHELVRLTDAAERLLLSDELSPGSAEERVLLTVREGGGSLTLDALRSACGAGTERAVKTLTQLGCLTRETTAQRQVNDKTVRMAHLAMEASEAMALAEAKRRSAPVRYEAVSLLCREGTISSADLCYYTGATMQTLRGLEKAGVLTFTQEESLRVGAYAPPAAAAPIVLNDEQRAAFDAVSARMDADEPSVVLLQGVTASGKTQVYIQLISAALARGKTALLLVPEIALTPQMLAKFTAYFGDKVALLHSALKLTERYDQWKRIRRGEVSIVLGTRSAVFAPLNNLGLVVMDEEQETTYQSENPPRYHTRDIAKYRCGQERAVLLLGSATPSVESAYQAEQGVYQRIYLRRRYNERSLPAVLIADMRQELRAGSDSAISATLRRELADNIDRGEQSILFLNRRGSSRMLLCGECGMVPECPRCSVPMTYHSANGRLMCHYCGHSQRAYEVCPDCGGIMKHVGVGTQKVEQELSQLFPDAAVLRMDTDTVGASQGHEKLLRRFEKENIPILLGTQMVAKGLDFENVTLVGVLAADLSLYMDNYHAAERTFSLLAQVVGRAGRGDKNGRAVIQTFTPENDVICAAAAQDYQRFYESEIRMRRNRRYPPFADLFTLTVTGTDEGKVLRGIMQLREGLRRVLAQQAQPEETDLLGPSAAPVTKVNNRYRYRLFLVGKNDAPTRRVVAYMLSAFYAQKENRGLDFYADCNSLQ